MKRAAAGLACLAAAISGTYAAPATRRNNPRNEARATLGDAIQASIQDAIRGAVTKVKAHHAAHETAHEAHSTDISALPEHIASAALSVSRNSSKAETKKSLITKGKSLRGSSSHKVRANNPWEPAKPLRIIDDDLSPVPPMNDLEEGIEAQRGLILPPGYFPRAVYYPPHQDVVNPFPQHYREKMTAEPQNFVECHTSPVDWVDLRGFGCTYYETAGWCTRDGKEGPMWSKAWGTLRDYAVEQNGPAEACCECGGGSQQQRIGHPGTKALADRHLIAAADRLPDPQARWFERNNPHLQVPERPLRPNQAPEDYVPIPIRQVAPADRVDMKYSRYFNELYKQNQESVAHKGNVPRGFSVRYYDCPPNDCATPFGSAIVHTLAFGPDQQGAASMLSINASLNKPMGVYMTPKNIEWPGKRKKAPSVYWMKFSGTLVVMTQGRYSFNFNIGWNTESFLKVDGLKILTDGQCIVSKDAGTCKAKGCAWDNEAGACKAQGKKHKKTAAPTVCKAGQYRATPLLFDCKPSSGEAQVHIYPASATSVMTIPVGVRNFQISVSSADNSEINVDLRLYDNATKTWVVNFQEGIVNQQQKDGTYHGMGVEWSGSSLAQQYVKLNGRTSTPIEVQIMSYAGNPANVRLVFSHGGLCDCADGVKGCEKLDQAAANKKIAEWSARIQSRYGGHCHTPEPGPDPNKIPWMPGPSPGPAPGPAPSPGSDNCACENAWQAVLKMYPGGQVRWGQFEIIWSMAWGQEGAKGAPGGNSAWQMAFAILDTGRDGYISVGEFMPACGVSAAGPGPAPSPMAMPKFGLGVTPYIGPGPAPPPAPMLTDFDNVEPIIVGNYQPDDETHNLVWKIPDIAGGFVQEDEEAPSPGPAPGPAGKPFDGIESTVQLDAGGHCIEAWVMVTPGARQLALEYSGSDTGGKMLDIPGQMVNCDPIIPACTVPARDVCALYRDKDVNGNPAPSCAGPSPGPAPAPAED